MPTAQVPMVQKCSTSSLRMRKAYRKLIAMRVPTNALTPTKLRMWIARATGYLTGKPQTVVT